MTSNELKCIRKKNNLTQSKMADFLGITLRTIQKYESGENAIPLSISKLLNHEFNSQSDIVQKIKGDNNIVTAGDGNEIKIGHKIDLEKEQLKAKIKELEGTIKTLTDIILEIKK